MKKYAFLIVTASLAFAGCGSKENPANPAPTPVVQKPVAPPADASTPPTAQADPSGAPPPPGPAAAPTQQVFAAFDPARKAEPVEAPATDGSKLSDQDIQNLNYAVDMYKTEFGHYPKSIQDMMGTRHLGRMPVPGAGQKLNYDPKTGHVSLEGK